ncbi:hypothetical protein LPB85_06525 [Chryseobacterium sp. LC2016-27]|uniref:pyocin knob domain-containing protein n=1 Tax=Chryseobacterium sp. LC2016-27 TaxID=2897326 RepID=UPI001E541850|nr:pyocin knob domain-containing protein [Chryseobacterium sp. LC2016-27]MCD0455102.1 hypothetical protein [Chryseobacterium sp. LC2016-27]
MDTKYAYYSTSKGYRVVGGTAAHFLKADGSLDNNSYALVNLTVPYTGATSDLTLADKNLNFTSGSISKFENAMRVFNKVFQNTIIAAQTGILSLKFPQASTSATLFDVTIKIYNHENRSLGRIRVSFYKQSNTIVNPTIGAKAIIECSDTFPTNIVRVGIDNNNNVCINIGEISTLWSAYLNIEVERLQTSYTGGNSDWSKNWSGLIETVAPSVPDTYKYLVNIVPDVLATRSWTDSNLIGSIPKSPITLGTLDLNTLLTPGFYNQSSDANATIERNYPITNAGALNVYKTTNNGVAQEYTTYHTSATYKRIFNGATWIGWKTILNSIDTIPQLANYIPLSQKGVASGVPTLDATIQIPNAQIPQRLLNKVIALGGETADTSFTGLYDRNQLALADKEHTVTSVINGAGTFNSSVAGFNNTIFNSKSDFSTITGADATTEVVITITFSSVLSNYGRGLWQPFVQTRLTAGQQFRDIVVEVMDSSNVWYTPAAFNVQNVTLIPNSGLFLFPETQPGTSSIKAVRFKLSNVQTTNGIAYVSNIGFRHVSHSFAPQFPHRGENNTFFGVNTFSQSPIVPPATISNQAVNFGQIVNFMHEDNIRPISSVDLNTYKTQGFYAMSTFTNGPVGAGNYGNLLVTQSASDRFMQMYFDQSNNNVNVRNGTGQTTVWGSWKNITDRDWVNYGLGNPAVANTLTDFNNFTTELGNESRIFSSASSNPLNRPLTISYPSGLFVSRSTNVQSMLVFGGYGTEHGLAYRNKLSNGNFSDWVYAWTSANFNPVNYVMQSSLISQLGNYATLNGVQTFSNTITFSQSPIVPDPTLLPHAVNYGFMANAIEESQNAIVGYVGGNYIPLSQKGSINGVATLDASGLIPSTQLPSYVDDVIEAPSLATLNALPAGEKQTGKIYVTTNTNLSYRWSGTVFVEISSGAVQSVNGQTGVVNLTFSDVGASSVNHTHTIAQVTGLQSALDGKVDDAQVLTNVPAGALFTDTIYTLPTATSTVKGGVEIFSDTVQSVASNSVTNTANRTYGMQLNSAGQAVVNVPWSNDNTTYTAGNGLTLSGTVFSLPVTISGSGNYITDVTQNTNGITVTKGSLPSYTLLVATSNSLGGVRLITDTVNNVAPNAATTTVGRSYAVQLNNSNQAIVNVPWTDNNTTYTSSNGIALTGTNFAPTFGTTANTIAQGNDSRINNGQTAFGYGDHNLMGYTTQAWVDENFVKTNNGISIDITGQNLNTYKKTGFYKGLNLTGAPNDNNGWWYVIIESHDVDSWAKQTATSFGSANVENITYQRVKKMGVWSPWVQIWTTRDFTTTNIQQWNYMAQYGLQLNADFTVHTGSGLMISDDHFGGESGIIDNKQRRFVAAKIGEYYKYGSGDKDGLEGINYHLEKKNIGIGGDADSKNKVRVQGCVKALENFRSKDERPDTIFIPNGETATLRDEIINDESEYAIRLDPHEYEIDPSGSLEIDDRNRLIHVIGEQIKMVVDFRKIYPKQQIVIYNFDQNGGTMAVKIQGKTIASLSARCFLRLYVTKSSRVIAERQQPCEFVW